MLHYIAIVIDTHFCLVIDSLYSTALMLQKVIKKKKISLSS